MLLDESADLSVNDKRVLVLPPTRRDAEAIEKLLCDAGLSCVTFRTMPALCEAIGEGAGGLVISEEAIAAELSTLESCLRQQPVWSDLPILVLARAGMESASVAEAMKGLANVSVIERPVRTSTLTSLIRSNLRARERQYQVRDHLIAQQYAQKTIREQEQRYRLVIENVSDYAIFMLDLNGRIISWNDGAQRILGYNAGEILGSLNVILFTPEDQYNRVPETEMTTAREMGRASDVRWHLRKDRRRIFVDGIMTTVRDSVGILIGYVKFMKDITEKHLAEVQRDQLLASETAARSEAERAGRMKDEFLATLSHELRTPLNAILGWSQILRTSTDPEDVTEGITIIERNARSQAQIIEDLLDMSRIISGKVSLEVQNVDLAMILRHAVETVRPTADTKGVRLQAVLDTTSPHIAGDPNRLQQVFWNILTNAVKFTPREGRVSITLERVESHLSIQITDSGEGIDPEFLPHVFDRFRQADGSTTRRHGGLGLGLSIVKQLVELHGGSIVAESDGKEKGSCFRVTLPIIAAHPIDAATHGTVLTHNTSSSRARNGMPLPDLEGLRILVIDDEPDARKLIRRLLVDCKATVFTAGSAHEAFDIVLQHKPDLIVSDIGMPGEDGYGFIRRLRASAGDERATPALALTAYARVEDRIKAIGAGFQSHLAKPVDPDELFTMIRSLVGR